MSERFGSGDAVTAAAVDVSGHVRLPRYVRGRTGEVVEVTGSWRRPEDVVAGRETAPQPVYTVRFAARELWGSGDHSVCIDLWEGYLQPAGEGSR